MANWMVHDVYASIPECAGHVPLSVVFAQFVAVECDIDPFDQINLREELDGPSCTQQVMRWLVRCLQSGSVRSSSRPLGGGPLTSVPASHWQADLLAERFVTSQYPRSAPYDPKASADAWLFVLEDDFHKLWEELRTRVLGVTEKPSKKPKALTPERSRRLGEEGGLLVGLPAVELLVGLRRSTIYKLMAEDRFPAQVKVGGRSLWRRDLIEQWVASVGDQPA
jgi:prophage regulatory protein